MAQAMEAEPSKDGDRPTEDTSQGSDGVKVEASASMDPAGHAEERQAPSEPPATDTTAAPLDTTDAEDSKPAEAVPVADDQAPDPKAEASERQTTELKAEDASGPDSQPQEQGSGPQADLAIEAKAEEDAAVPETQPKNKPEAETKEAEPKLEAKAEEGGDDGTPAGHTAEAEDQPVGAAAAELTKPQSPKPTEVTAEPETEAPQAALTNEATPAPAEASAGNPAGGADLEAEPERVPDTPEAEHAGVAPSEPAQPVEVAESEPRQAPDEKIEPQTSLKPNEAVPALQPTPTDTPIAEATKSEDAPGTQTGTQPSAAAAASAPEPTTAAPVLKPIKAAPPLAQNEAAIKRTPSAVSGLPVTPGMEAVLGKRRARTMAGQLVDSASVGIRSPSARGVPQSTSPCKGVEADLEYLYKAILIEYRPELKAEDRRKRGKPAFLELPEMTSAVRKLRDTKLFVKDYKGELEPKPIANPSREQRKAGDRGTDVRREERIRLHVTVPLEDSGSTCRQIGGVPSEVVIMSRRSTIADLKKAAAAAFTANYRIFEKFIPKEMQGIHGEAQSDRVRLTHISDGEKVLLRGKGLDQVGNSVWRHTGGSEDWTVDCKCGTVDDDGARMNGTNKGIGTSAIRSGDHRRRGSSPVYAFACVSKSTFMLVYAFASVSTSTSQSVDEHIKCRTGSWGRLIRLHSCRWWYCLSGM
eukprot:scaffold55431_cov38-Prasinocladus_malaysianus.AAC.1